MDIKHPQNVRKCYSPFSFSPPKKDESAMIFPYIKVYQNKEVC